MPSTSNAVGSLTNGNHWTSTEYMLKEAERFESFYKDILQLHGLLENVENILLRRQLREIINKIQEDFVCDPDLTIPKCSMYNTSRLGIIGGSLSGKSAVLQRFLTGEFSVDDAIPGKHKKVINVNGNPNLMLMRDETGSPDAQFSLWADAVLLVFNTNDELSFNVISNYYAKMVQYRNNRELPCILVGVKDVDSYDSNCEAVEEVRIKKLISDYRNCPFYCVSLESGENIDEAFLAAVESIIKEQTFPTISSYNSLLSSSVNSISTLDDPNTNLSLQNGAATFLHKKYMKRRNTLFSMKNNDKKEKEEQKTNDDFGSGRQIPIKQGYLYKRHQSSLKEWKKKYVLISEDQVFSYYPSMKDYMDDSNVKSIKLIHSSVKISGKRTQKAVVPNNIHKASSKGFLNQNILTSPIKSRSNRNSSSDCADRDCYVIQNSSISEPTTEVNISGLSPTLQRYNIERSFSDGRDVGPPTNLRNAQSHESFPLKMKHRSHKAGSNRYKSCEIDFQPNLLTTQVDVGVASDLDAAVISTPLLRKKSFQHKRQKSSNSLKEVIPDSRATDNEDDDYIFSLVNIDGKVWDFECASVEERDKWVQTIEQQILKAFQDNKRKFSDADLPCKSQSYLQNGLTVQDKLFTVEGNDKCADCGSPAPSWASLNIGILICIECSGVHRNLGSHLSRVRSVLLDDWPDECIKVLEALGNAFVNSLFEANLNGYAKPKPNAAREDRERWITLKYEKKEFLAAIDKTKLKQNLMLSVEEENLQRCYLQLIYCLSGDVNTISTVKGYGYKLAPLHLACVKANVPITQILLWYHGDSKILDERGYNPIFYANKCNSKQCADLLYSYGCPEDTPC